MSMKCSKCGGVVEWKGPLTALTHTECTRCGAINAQLSPEEDYEAQHEIAGLQAEAFVDATINRIRDLLASHSTAVAEFAVHMQRQVNEAREIADLIQASGWEHSVVDRTVTVKDPTGVLAARLWKDFHTRNGHANGKN